MPIFPATWAILVGMSLTIFGVVVLTFMMSMYALEARGRGFVVAFAVGCGLSSLYGFLSGAWPFGVVEAVWVFTNARLPLTEAAQPD
jgi:predicted membrane-bound mannosyltransferase